MGSSSGLLESAGVGAGGSVDLVVEGKGGNPEPSGNAGSNDSVGKGCCGNEAGSGCEAVICAASRVVLFCAPSLASSSFCLHALKSIPVNNAMWSSTTTMTAIRMFDRPRLAPSKFIPGGIIGLVPFIILPNNLVLEPLRVDLLYVPPKWRHRLITWGLNSVKLIVQNL